MSIRSGIFNYLSNQSTITAIVGTAPPRIYPVALPEGKPRPALLYKRVEGGHDSTLKGSGGHALGKFEFDAIADNYSDADALAEALRQVMQGFVGTFGDTAVRAVVLEEEVDDYLGPVDGSGRGVYTITLTYAIRYTESVPTP